MKKQFAAFGSQFLLNSEMATLDYERSHSSGNLICSIQQHDTLEMCLESGLHPLKGGAPRMTNSFLSVRVAEWLPDMWQFCH